MRRQAKLRPDKRRVVRVRYLLAGTCVLLLAAVTILAVWTAPPAGLLGPHRTVLHDLRWIHEHWLNAVAITALGTIFLVVVTIGVPFFMRRLDRTDSWVAAKAARERKTMLRRVHHKWISGVLEPSLADTAQLVLGLERRPDALNLGSRVIRRPTQPPAPFPDGTSITKLFHQVGGGLLILGAPGAGKTTMLLQLAAGLIEAAERDPGEPIPVVLNLASWGAHHGPLATWLTEELAVSYNVPEPTASDWVEQDALVLLLDGLDEVARRHRAACAEAIGAYRCDHGLVPMAVCGRTQEVDDLNAELRLDETVELEPPTDTQIDSYLGHLEATGTPLADVRAAVAIDDCLRDLLRSPLMLHVITLAYHGQQAPALHLPGTAAERRELLWAAYITRMFEQRPLSHRHGYSTQRALSWLGWLARTMQDSELSEFHLDRLTVGPKSLLPTSQNWLIRQGEDLFRQSEELRWSWTTLIRPGLPSMFNLAFATLAFALLAQLVVEPSWQALTGLSLVPIIVLFLGLTSELRGERTEPNEGVQRAGRNGIVLGLASGMSFGVGCGLLYGPGQGLWAALGTGFVTFLVYGGGAFLSHYSGRAFLVTIRAIPWRYQAFLDAMTERLLLRRGGGSYLFVHRMLRDHLADRVTFGPYPPQTQASR